MKVTIHRDQAVWERQTFEVEVPDGLPEDDMQEAIGDAVEKFDETAAPEDWTQEILDEIVFGVDTETTAVLPDGTEIAL